ncbi:MULTISPECIES: pantoate--beta-alanine ligase [unclassified Paenibacillus]|uniref:pantoate--beta-alanine ligase n=1 Tax=unclassified Paenibacillus TaxID=185978 RepID=UPI001C1036D1|nr:MULTISPECIES: pantoate--beta-alanine ligase [unclassified Paenibacillus]MBU5444005.1 pantoate--beta-alanine ligase [Paenibacillus sp. MSJ-34]CAH0118786.1 Pantothenate synthetase [Paenibacillus sp. CECT 9249]
MIVLGAIEDIRSELARLRRNRSFASAEAKVGFVPTMGYLHEGHVSLLRQAKATCDIVVLSIFVNPIQFGPGEDLDKYPRDEKRDLDIARKAGVDVVFMPTVETMYPHGAKTYVKVAELTERLCGASRPGHFDGVSTVVTKLFNIVKPDKAFFGLKDAQQIAVIEQMVQDLNIDVEIVACPIVREEDGLAMSSRNVYLSPEEREQALVLSQALGRIEDWIGAGANSAEALRSQIVRHIESAPLARIDYVDILTFPALQPIEPGTDISERRETIIVALAVKFGHTRLIDNRLLPQRASYAVELFDKEERATCLER